MKWYVYKFFEQLTKRNYTLDKVIAIAVLCASIILIALSIGLKFYSGVHLLAAILVGALSYLLLRNRLLTGAELPQLQLGSQIRSLSHIIFVISLSLIIYLTWSNLYYRPPIYFIMCLVAAASIVLDVFALDETKRSHTPFVLFKIITLAITIYSGLYYQFPGIYGVDSWWHNRWIQETINLGHITEGEYTSNDYFLFPVFQLSSAITQIVTGMSTYTAIFVSTGVMIAVSSLFVFLIGERLVNTKVGLLAALIIPFTDEVIVLSTAIIAMSLAFCFFPAILYLILGRDRKRVSDSLVVILLSVALILTHTIAALVTLLSIITVFLSIRLFKKIGKLSVSYESVSLALITFFGLAMLARWMQPPYVARPFFDMNVSNLADTLRFGAQFIMTGQASTKNVAFAVSVLDRGGYLLLLALAVIGALIYLHPKNRTGTMIALVSIAAVLTVLPNIFDLFSLPGLLPPRWLPFSYVLLSVLAVSCLLRISSLITGNIGKISMIMLIILAVIFMMTTNATANADSPQVFNGTRRAGYTQSELTAINTLSDMGVGRPTTDLYYGLIFPYVAGYDEYADMEQGDSRVFVQRNYFLHHPEWSQHYRAELIVGGFQDPEVRRVRVLLSDYKRMWGIDEWPVIYCNQNVIVYSSATVIPDR